MMIFPELFRLHSYGFYIASLAVSRLSNVQVCPPAPYVLARALRRRGVAAAATHAFGTVLPDK